MHRGGDDSGRCAATHRPASIEKIPVSAKILHVERVRFETLRSENDLWAPME